MGVAAQAEGNPYYVGANVALTHDSNVFHLPNALADTAYSAGLLAGFDQLIGRQRVYASGRIRDTRFQDLKQLDNTSYAIRAGVDWETIDKLSGTLSLSRSEDLFNDAGTNTAPSTARNIETRSEGLVRVRYGAASLLAVEAAYSHRSLRYSDLSYETNGLTQDAGSAGLFYRPGAAWRLGAGLRYTRGQYEGSGRDFERRDIDLTATWLPTGLSTLDGRLSLGQRETLGGTSKLDFSGTTGRLDWTYQPTGKLQVKTSLSRETGAESTFLNASDATTRSGGDTSRITDAVAIHATYAWSAKIRIDGDLRANHRSLINGAVDGSDSLRGATIGLSYAPLRNLAVSCQVGRQTRTASGSLSFGYGSTSAVCSAEIKLQ